MARFPKADVNGFGHPKREGWVCRRSIFPTDLMDGRLLCGEIVLDITARRRGQGNVSWMDICRLSYGE